MIQIDSINSLDNGVEFLPAVIKQIEERGHASIDAAFLEHKETFKERTPYVAIPMLDEMCYRWADEFIDGIKIAMATDRLVQFSNDELKAWRYFVNFQNYHTHSARSTDANGTAIGCTNPGVQNASFVVGGNGLPVQQLCQNPGYEIEGEQIWKSLDTALMSLYNCEEINPCTNDLIPQEPVECST